MVTYHSDRRFEMFSPESGKAPYLGTAYNNPTFQSHSISVDGKQVGGSARVFNNFSAAPARVAAQALNQNRMYAPGLGMRYTLPAHFQLKFKSR